MDVDLTTLTDEQVRAVADDRVAVLTAEIGDAFPSLADRAKEAIDEIDRRNQIKRAQIARLREALA